VLPAATFAGGPASGQYIGPGPIAGQPVPFAHQPVQGFSALLPDRHARGVYWALIDNGFGSEETSADSDLRLYRVRPDLSAPDRTGSVRVLGHLDLADPDHRVPFTITNEFTRDRLLTGADFDPESAQQAPDGTFWIGDEFGPFLLHFGQSGRLLQAPITQPDLDHPGQVLRSPQNPGLEEPTALRVMNALRQHAQQFGGVAPILSPDASLLADGDPSTVVPNRAAPPAGSGLDAASSEILDVAKLHTDGFKVVPYTVDSPAQMDKLLRLGVDGLISDDSDLLYQRVAAFDKNGDGIPGDYLLPDGRIDPAKFDAQGHRGSRDLRPENTLPAFEAGLDNLVSTVETDTGISRDGVPVIDHDPAVTPDKCRRADGRPLPAGGVLIRDLTAAQIQARFVCDLLLPGRPRQTNDLALSPVATAFAAARHLPNGAYTKPTLQNLFDFANFYARWFATGPGRGEPGAAVQAANAAAVRFNVETKINPRPEFADRTIGPVPFERIDDAVIAANHLQSRVTLQSFDWRTLLLAQAHHPDIRTVALVGDFPVYADPAIPGSDDGTNLQPVRPGGNTPWLGGLRWPYRQTLTNEPVRVQQSGGYEGMAISADGRRLYPVLEHQLDGVGRTLLVAEFDIARRAYTGNTWNYPLDPTTSSVPDFQFYAPNRALALERDNSTGTTLGVKLVYAVTFGAPGSTLTKTRVADLLHLADPAGIARHDPFAQPGDLVGDPGEFAMPYVTIESVLAPDRGHLIIVNDNNYPFSVGRHLGTRTTDDDDFIRITLNQPLPT
jgi:glycerophosphoryl diester phosphodiesterase